MYLVTSFGRVYSVVRRDKYCRILGGGEISPQLSAGGYRFVALYKNGKGKQFYVHQLVARAFIPNPENKDCVDHIDNIKDNNNVSNLRWVTHKENMNNTITMMRMHNESAKYISQAGADNPFSRKIAMYTLDGELIKVYESGGQIEKEYGIGTSSISRVCRGERAQTHGYVFRYMSEAKRKIIRRTDGMYSSKPVIQLDLDDNFVAEYQSIMAAAKAVDAYPSNLGKAVNGRQKTCKGFKWRYKQEA